VKKHRLSIHHLLPGLSLVFTLFVFAPVDLYLSIGEELWFPLSTLVRWLAIYGAAVFAVITLLSLLLPVKASIVLRSVVYACSFMAYLQGNVLLLDYGTLNGRAIDWSKYTVPHILNTLLWAAVIAAFVFCMFRFRKKFRRIVEIAACVLLVTQAVTLGFLLVRNRGVKQEVRYLTNEGLYTVSAGQNTVVFVLDTFDSKLFDRLCRDYTEEISGEFADFTFYPDTVGGATRTQYGIPFIFTGKTNTEGSSYKAYLKDSFSSSPLVAELASGKYDSRVYSFGNYFDLSREDAIHNVGEGTPLALSRRKLTEAYMKLVAFRYAPSALARFFWMYTGDFEQYKSDIGNGAYGVDDAGFGRNLASRGLSATAGKDSFRFIHFNGAHDPYTLDEQGNRAGQTDEETQVRGALRIVSRYLQKLKDLGVYDNTTVFVMADHGYLEYEMGEYLPLLMIKRAGESHPFEISDEPLSYASIAEMLSDALRGEMDSMEKYRADGPRYYYVHALEDRKSFIAEFVIDGPAQDAVPQETGRVFYEDTQPAPQE